MRIVVNFIAKTKNVFLLQANVSLILWVHSIQNLITLYWEMHTNAFMSIVDLIFLFLIINRSYRYSKHWHIRNPILELLIL